MPRIFPPVPTEIPAGYWRNGLGRTSVETQWGQVRIPVQRLIDRQTGRQLQVPLHADVDASGWAPDVLRRLLDLVVRLPFAEASLVALHLGVKVSASELERLYRPYASTLRRMVSTELLNAKSRSEHPEVQSAGQAATPARLMVLQTDGVYVLGRPEAGRCPGLELKTAVLYNQNSPANRWMIADRVTSSELLPRLAGLLHLAGVTPADTLICLGDGAAWISSISSELAAISITDVYHACEYLETMMTALGWDEATRLKERRAWYRGEVNARDWLRKHQPQPGITRTWDEEAITALGYLTSRVDSMDYRNYKTLGYPIGSGQIEGINKNVIGTRMKRSGAHWSENGSGDMAACRAQAHATNPITTYQNIRHHAYPHFASSA